MDELIGQQDIVIKSLGRFLSKIRGIAGATILGDGNVALILDVDTVVGERRVEAEAGGSPRLALAS